MRVTDGKFKETTNEINDHLEWLGTNMSTMFAREYKYLTPIERTKVFLQAIEISAHDFSIEHSEAEQKKLADLIDNTANFSRSFLVS